MILKILCYVVIILVASILILFMMSHMGFTKRRYMHLAKARAIQNNKDPEVITEEDLKHLPKLVRDYLIDVGVLGREKVQSYTVLMKGKFKMNEQQAFRDITVHQTSYQTDLTRLFYMEMTMLGAKITGLHRFMDDHAHMEVRLLDLFQVVDEQGEIMNISETVTIFNDMCLLAPHTLIDPKILWKEIDEASVEATFTRGQHTIKAILYFNPEHQLINFVSDDRYAIHDGLYEKIRWSTPMTSYRMMHGYHLPSEGSAIWSYPDRDYAYIQLTVMDVRYNEKIHTSTRR